MKQWVEDQHVEDNRLKEIIWLIAFILMLFSLNVPKKLFLKAFKFWR
jgi:hypothetical protein